jgi:hypothetical protein
LHTATRINRLEEKSAIVGISGTSMDLNAMKTATSYEPVSASNIIDVTQMVDKDGNLHWNARVGFMESGNFGYSLQGIQNHPASPEATGLEVDKLDPWAVQRYFENYSESILKSDRRIDGYSRRLAIFGDG